MSNWPQFRLILKNKHSSLKWAQIEVDCSIRLGATVFQSWPYFWQKENFTPFFQELYFLNKLSNWPQLGLIVKNKHSSLKWAQIEVDCSIRLGATVFQSWPYFWQKENFTPFFQELYFLNELSNWSQLRLILKNKHSSLKWAQVEVNCSNRLGAAVSQSWCFFFFKEIFTPLFVAIYSLNKLSNWSQLRLILKNTHRSLKWPQVEVCSSIRWGVTVFQCCFLFQSSIF